MNTTAEQLFHLIEKGGSPYQVVEEAEKRLKEAGFEKLEFHTAWGLTLSLIHISEPTRH